ncbi:MAG: hypothetical protein U0736_17630 [Gemmataceae bacterium]
MRLSFEAGDIVSNVMSFGASTPVEVAVHGPSLPDNLAHAEKIRRELERIPRSATWPMTRRLTDLEVVVDRPRAGFVGVTASDVGNALAPGHAVEPCHAELLA